MKNPDATNSLAASWTAGRTPEQIKAAISRFSSAEVERALYEWRLWARAAQLIPGTQGADLERQDWVYWLALAGRGWGKTRTGAETVRQWAENPQERILLIAPTAGDVREVMLEGESGLMACYPPGRRPLYNPTRHRIRFPSGAIGITRSADEPERLRGPQFSKFWADELCSWRYLQESWDQLQFGFRRRLRGGRRIQGLVTTTPKPSKVLQTLIDNPDTVITRGSSYDNRHNLDEAYYRNVIAPYEGTRLGRQEIYAEVLRDIPGALWTWEMIDRARRRINIPSMVRVVVAADPAVSALDESDETGIVCAGIAPLDRQWHVFVWEDATVKGSPLEWARRLIDVYARRRCDRVIGEVNNGGDLVERNIRATPGGANLPFRAVHASRGKALRAEPVAALYEQGRVHHVGTGLGKLEEQLASWVPGSGARSPDRLDALVWAVTDLLITPADVMIEVPISDWEHISSI